MPRRFPLVALLLGALVALVPLAYASPPDQTWISGFYDDADYDDAVMAVTSTAGALEAAPLLLVGPFVVVGVVPHAGAAGVAATALRAFQVRAPPVL